MNRKTSLKSNFIYNSCYQILAIILPLITAPYLSRSLGAHSVGVYSYTQAFANYFYLFAMLGVSNYGNRKISQVRDDHVQLSRTFWEIFSFQGFVAFIAALLYVAVCFTYIHEDRQIFLLQLFYILSGAFDINWFCFGMEQFKLTTIRSAVVRIASAAAIFAFIRGPKDLWIYTFIMSFGMLASVLAVWPYVLHTIQFRRPTLQGIAQHIKPNLVLFWPVVAVSLYNIMDKLMLGYFSTEEEVAFYTYAERVVQIPLTLILALDNVIMPRMSNLYASCEQERAGRLRDRGMLFVMFMCAPIAFGLAGIGQNFAPWFYGKGFSRCGMYIVFLSPVFVFKGWASAIRTQFIIPAGRDRIYVLSLSVGALVNLLLNTLLIPRWDGMGAIVGTLAAEFSVCFIQFYMSRKDVSLKKYLTDGVCFCLIGAVMYIPVKLAGNLAAPLTVTLLLQIVIGVVVYVVLGTIYVVKVANDEEMINTVLRFLHIKYRM